MTLTAAAEPFREIGSTPARPVCKCGRGPHRNDPGRCAGGHPLRGTAGPALHVGEHSLAFWQAHESDRREMRTAFITDAGHSPEDVPRGLALAADGAAQAKLVVDSAYLRMAEGGGPLSASGRARRAFDVWLAATDRLERYLRLLGLKRRARHVDPMEGVRLAVAVANRTRGDQ